jgi:hypothetical protein
MNKLIKALVRDKIVYDNGRPVKEGSGSKLLDAFASLGACRKKTDAEILAYWKAAWAESPEGTLRMAMYNRDVRGGQGERRTFRIFWQWLCNNHRQIAIDNIQNVPFFGRWDDLWSVEVDDVVFTAIADFVLAALLSGDKLCGKWMPREGKAKGDIAKKFAAFWGMTMQAYRGLIVKNTQVIESLMCAGEFGKINYSHVPSQASQRYRKAFLRRDEKRYRAYLAALVKGVKGVKVNAGAIYPHEVVKPLVSGYRTQEAVALSNAQWLALPNFVQDDESYIAVCDTSGSMAGLPLEVSIGLGLYLAERNRSAFKDCLYIFSARPTFIHLTKPTLSERIDEMPRIVSANTNIKAVFEHMLGVAVQNNVPAKDMPNAIIIISDMQFNTGVGEGFTQAGAFAMIDRQYEKAGYKRPRVIFWNVDDKSAKPAKFDTNGTALVSGFSPSIMQSIFKGVNPLEVMMNTLGSERYDRVVI